MIDQHAPQNSSSAGVDDIYLLDNLKQKNETGVSLYTYVAIIWWARKKYKIFLMSVESFQIEKAWNFNLCHTILRQFSYVIK